MKAKRQSTVEPVFGTLTQFMGLRKINTIGIKQANKCMHMSAIAYNLKKYLKFIKKEVKSGVNQQKFVWLKLNAFIESIIDLLSLSKFKIYSKS